MMCHNVKKNNVKGIKNKEQYHPSVTIWIRAFLGREECDDDKAPY